MRRLVLFVRDRDALEDKMQDLLQDPAYQGILFVETIDLREPQRIEQKFQNAMMRAF